MAVKVAQNETTGEYLISHDEGVSWTKPPKSKIAINDAGEALFSDDGVAWEPYKSTPTSTIPSQTMPTAEAPAPPKQKTEFPSFDPTNPMFPISQAIEQSLPESYKAPYDQEAQKTVFETAELAKNIIAPTPTKGAESIDPMYTLAGGGTPEATVGAIQQYADDVAKRQAKPKPEPTTDYDMGSFMKFARVMQEVDPINVSKFVLPFAAKTVENFKEKGFEQGMADLYMRATRDPLAVYWDTLVIKDLIANPLMKLTAKESPTWKTFLGKEDDLKEIEVFNQALEKIVGAETAAQAKAVVSAVKPEDILPMGTLPKSVQRDLAPKEVPVQTNLQPTTVGSEITGATDLIPESSLPNKPASSFEPLGGIEAEIQKVKGIKKQEGRPDVMSRTDEALIQDQLNVQENVPANVRRVLGDKTAKVPPNVPEIVDSKGALEFSKNATPEQIEYMRKETAKGDKFVEEFFSQERTNEEIQAFQDFQYKNSMWKEAVSEYDAAAQGKKGLLAQAEEKYGGVVPTAEEAEQISKFTGKGKATLGGGETGKRIGLLSLGGGGVGGMMSVERDENGNIDISKVVEGAGRGALALAGVAAAGGLLTGIVKPVLKGTGKEAMFSFEQLASRVKGYKPTSETIRNALKAKNNPLNKNDDVARIAAQYNLGNIDDIAQLEKDMAKMYNRDEEGMTIFDHVYKNTWDRRSKEALNPSRHVYGETEMSVEKMDALNSNLKTSKRNAITGKMEGAYIAGDTSRGCVGLCPECYAAADARKCLNFILPKRVKLTGDARKTPNIERRIGTSGEPAWNPDVGDTILKDIEELYKSGKRITHAEFDEMVSKAYDWSYLNKEFVSTYMHDPEVAKNVWVITKLPTIKGFDPKVVRNLHVSIDPLNPNHFFRAMKNVDELLKKDPTLNIALRVRSVDSYSDEVNALQKIVVDFANKNNLEVLETRIRFKGAENKFWAGLTEKYFKGKPESYWVSSRQAVEANRADALAKGKKFKEPTGEVVETIEGTKELAQKSSPLAEFGLKDGLHEICNNQNLGGGACLKCQNCRKFLGRFRDDTGSTALATNTGKVAEKIEDKAPLTGSGFVYGDSRKTIENKAAIKERTENAIQQARNKPKEDYGSIVTGFKYPPKQELTNPYAKKVEATFTPEETEIANRTSRTGGAVGSNAVVPRVVREQTAKGESVLDFGAGKDAVHAKALQAEGYDVTAYDFGGNVKDGVHDPTALSRKYDTVYASNVLNTQSTPRMMNDTINQIIGSMKPGGKAIINFPKSPRKLEGLGDADFEKMLGTYFGKVEKVDKSNNVFKVSEPKKGNKVVQAIADLLADERGAIGKLDPVQQEKVNKIIEQANKAGVKVEEFIKGFSLDEKTKKNILDAVKSVGKSTAKPATVAAMTEEKNRILNNDLVDMLKGKSRVPEGMQDPYRTRGGEREWLVEDSFKKAQGMKNAISETRNTATSQMMDDALKGDKNAYSQLPDNLKKEIDSARSDINALSKELETELEKILPNLENAEKKKTPFDLGGGRLLSPKDLLKRIRGNDQYVGRYYWYFEDPTKSFKPSKEAWDNAIEGILKDKNIYPDFTTPEDARKHLQMLLDRKNLTTATGQPTLMAKQGHYYTRTNVPEYLREFFGEVKDPAANYFLTVKDLASNVTQMKMFDDLSKAKDIFSDVQKGDHQILVSSRLPNRHYKYGAIADKYVTKEVADFLEDSSKISGVYDSLFNKALSLSKFAKTAGNIPTHARNVMGNLEFSILARTSPFNPLNIRYYKKAISGMSGKDPALRKLLIENRIINNEFAHSDLVKMMDDITQLEKGNTENIFKRGAKRTMDKMSDFYSMEDQIFKASAFLKYMEKEGMTAKMARDEVYKYFQNYDEVSKFAHNVRQSKWGAIMPFLSFQSEAMRIMGDAVKRGGADRYKALSLMGSRAGYNMARLVAAGYGVGEALQYMAKNDLFFSNLLTEQESQSKFKTLSQRGISPFNLNELYNPMEYAKGVKGNIIGEPVAALLSDKDKYGRPATLKSKTTETLSGVNSTLGAIAKAIKAKRGEGTEAFLEGISPLKTGHATRKGATK